MIGAKTTFSKFIVLSNLNKFIGKMLLSSQLIANLENNSKFRIIQASRFFAASIVVLFHLYLSRYYIRPPFGETFNFGFLGVDFFFVLSGFIILFVHWGDLNKPERLKSFSIKRIIRIYPSFLMVMIIIIPTFLLLPTLGLPIFQDPLYILQCLLLLPTKDEPILTVAWSLQHEILFYILFALLIWRSKIGFIVFIIWFTLSGLVGILVDYPFNFFFDSHHLQFMFGMLGAYILKTTQIRNPLTILYVGLAIFLGIAVFNNLWLFAGSHGREEPQRQYLYIPIAIASLAIIVGGIESEKQKLIFIPKIFDLLGNSSYILYLIHLPIIIVAGKIVDHVEWMRRLPPEIDSIIVYVSVIIISVFLYSYIEKPLLTKLSAKFKT